MTNYDNHISKLNKYYVVDNNIRNEFLLGSCELFAISKKIKNPKAQIVIINDDSRGRNRISLYHAVINENNKYYDANGLIALNNGMLKKYILENYSNQNNDFSIIIDDEKIKQYLSIMTGIDENVIYDYDEFMNYITDNQYINNQLLPYLK